jgi:peptidyl-prolyl cis-trans isomerase C
MPARSRAYTLFLALCAVATGAGCDEKRLDQPPAGSASVFLPSALPPELAAKPLATVGDKVITLGDYAATLERMDQFERLRYQSPDRRRQLLDEIIKVELLAGEARRRGLHDDPEIKERIRQILRDEVMKKLRVELPAASDIPESEVRAYYEKNKGEFSEPERRRLAHVVMSDRQKAQRVLEQAIHASPADWGRLVRQHSLDKPDKPSPNEPLELAGDLGIVSAPGSERGENPNIAEPLRRALFQIEKVGGVGSELVEHEGKFHIVRMTGKTDARSRTLAEADRTIRVALLQDKLEQAKQDLERELRGRYPVKIDEKALEKVNVPKPEPQPPGAAPQPPK